MSTRKARGSGCFVRLQKQPGVRSVILEYFPIGAMYILCCQMPRAAAIRVLLVIRGFFSLFTFGAILEVVVTSGSLLGVM